MRRNREASGKHEGLKNRSNAPIGVIRHRSRITNNHGLLPDISPQSTWGRLYRDTVSAVYSHLGGQERASELELMTARQLAVLNVEAVYQATKIGMARNEGREPEACALDLYIKLINASRRHAEALGWQRKQIDVTPDLHSYLRAKSAEPAAVDLEVAPTGANGPAGEDPLIQSSVGTPSEGSRAQIDTPPSSPSSPPA